MKAGTKVIYITRDNKTVPTGNNRTITYTIEKVFRGVWDGEKAVLKEKFDPRGLEMIVRRKDWLIEDKE